MWLLAVIWLIWILYTGFTEKKRANRDTIEYEEEQNESLGLEPWKIRMEKMCPTKNKNQSKQ